MTHSIKIKHKNINIKRTSAEYYMRNLTKPYMTKKQASAIASLVNALNPLAHPLYSKDILKQGKNYIFTINKDDNNTVSGVAKLKRYDWKRCEICNVHVAESFRKQGFGKRLLDKAEERAGKRGFTIMDAIILEDNTPSKRLFKNRGFTKQIIYANNKDNTTHGIWRKNIKKPCRKKRLIKNITTNKKN